VVADQHGAPTWSRTVAQTTADILAQARGGGADWWESNGGLYHLGCQGQTTWHGFAEAIMEATSNPVPVIPISTNEFPTAARRPLNSLLDSSRLANRLCRLPEWRETLALCLQ
jgi:dTDP-4-dehydrorhamnose reductase